MGGRALVGSLLLHGLAGGLLAGALGRGAPEETGGPPLEVAIAEARHEVQGEAPLLEASPQEADPPAPRRIGLPERSPRPAPIRGTMRWRRPEASAESASETVVPPEVGHNPPPEYPPEARRRRIEGRVLLEAEISEDGIPERVRIAESSGHAELDGAAAEAVGRWRFRPARRGGRAVAWTVRVPVRFRIRA